MEDKGLQDRVVSGFSWLTLTTGVEVVGGIAKSIILARLLQPRDFGIFAIAVLFMEGLQALSKTGFGEALIYQRKDPHQYLREVWTIGFIRIIVIAALLAGLAPYVATFFKEPNAVKVMYLLAIAIFIQGFKNPALFLFQREMQFKRYALINHSKFWADMIVSLIAAFLLKNVYALAFGYIASSVTWTLVSYYAHPFRPRFSWDIRKYRELYSYGKWVTLQQVTFFASSNAEIAVLGRMLDSTLLGFYRMARQFAFYAQSLFEGITQPVMFPAFSEIQEDEERVHVWARVSFIASILLAGFVATAIYASADAFVPVVLGEKWSASVPLLKILALASFLYIPMFSVGTAFFRGMGRPDADFKLQALKLALLLGLSIFGVNRYGLNGAAWALLATLVILIPLWLYYFSRVLSRSLRFLVAPVIVAASPLIVIAGIQFAIEPEASIVGLIIWALAGIAASIVAFSVGYITSHVIHDAMSPLVLLAWERRRVIMSLLNFRFK